MEERDEGLFDAAPCGIVRFTDDGKIVFVNATLLNMLGRERSEIEGLSVGDLLSPGGRFFYQTHFYPALRLHRIVEEVHFDLRAKDGSDVPVLAYAVRRERAGRTFNDCIFLHTRQRLLYEDELLLAKKEAEHARDAKAKFLSMMSHDLRSPLQAIFAYAALFEDRSAPLPPLQAKAAAGIMTAARVMERMLGDVLAFAQLESGMVEMRVAPVSVGEIVARAEVLVVARMKELGLHYRREAPPEDCVVRADPDRLLQVLLNLLANAIKFTRRDGTITIAVSRRESRCTIEVHDTGIGIPADRFDAIFEAFVQIDPQTVTTSQRGVGLGLSISRDLTRAMGGEISVSSIESVGSVFGVTLHLVE